MILQHQLGLLPAKRRDIGPTVPLCAEILQLQGFCRVFVAANLCHISKPLRHATRLCRAVKQVKPVLVFFVLS
jgi:hypothetical protein